MKVFVNSIKYNRSLVDGPGVRTVLFLQGCDLHCKGCQNPSTWDMKKGKEMTVEELVKELKSEVVNKKLTISGGEPLMQKSAVEELVTSLKGFDIALYTGHKKEDVPTGILSKIKYLKTGRFERDKKTTVKPYVGSTNQIFEEIVNAE